MPSKVKYFYELTVSSSPHVHGPNRTGRLMLDVILALLPALVGAVVSFGPRVLLVCGLSVAACVFFEWGYRKVMKLDNTVRDLSAVVTGLLLAFVCPVTIPYWTILVGDFFAIIIVKQLFGGIGKNFMNPALAARAFLFSWPVIMTTWVQPGDWAPLFGSSADAVTSATPLASLHQSALPAESLMSLFLGKTGGTGIGGKILAGMNSNNWFDLEHPWYSIGLVAYIVMVIFFAYFYTSITFNPLEVADNMKKQGGFIPGIRPGKPTVDYLTKMLNYIIFIGAAGLTIVAVIPFFFNGVFGANVSFGGTSIIIIVGVILETLKQIESMMLVRNYKGFLDN